MDHFIQNVSRPYLSIWFFTQVIGTSSHSEFLNNECSLETIYAFPVHNVNGLYPLNQFSINISIRMSGSVIKYGTADPINPCLTVVGMIVAIGNRQVVAC